MGIDRQAKNKTGPEYCIGVGMRGKSHGGEFRLDTKKKTGNAPRRVRVVFCWPGPHRCAHPVAFTRSPRINRIPNLGVQ